MLCLPYISHSRQLSSVGIHNRLFPVSRRILGKFPKFASRFLFSCKSTFHSRRFMLY